MPSASAPIGETLTPEERQLLDSPDTKEVYVNRLLHKRLRQKSADEGKTIRALVEGVLWKRVGGRPADTAPTTKEAAR